MLKTLILNLAFISWIFVPSVNSQIKAVTENGDTIYVYNNGTWSYEIEGFDEQSIFGDLEKHIAFDTIKELSKFNPSADKSLLTNLGQFEFKYDNESWKRVPSAELNDDAEFAFQHRQHDVYAIVITEETEIGTENIFRIAMNSMGESSQNPVEIVKAECKNVNGTEVLRGVFKTNISGIEFIFDSYYFSDIRGTTQLTSWTGSNLWLKHEEKIVDFLNGLIIKK